jgi:uncharacterized protein YceH (UPF0502 family)
MSPEAIPSTSAISPDDPHSSPDSAAQWPVLSPIERRILGVLVEKQKTSRTADAYPLTLNALVTGCNQKSNRDPVLELDEVEVEEGLMALQQKGLVERVTGGRAERFRHRLYDVWTRNGPELAVLAELLLRGAQTRGDLRGRAGRMDSIESLDALDEILKSLAARRLVTYLSDPDRRGALVTHGFHTPEELQGLRSRTPAAVDVTPSPPAAPAAAAAWEANLAKVLTEIDSLKERTLGLEKEVAELKRQLGSAATNQ